MKKTVLFVLCLALLLGCCACAGESKTGGQTEGFSAADTLQAEPNAVPQPEQTPAPAAEASVQTENSGGIGPEEIVLTVNGEGVTWEEFRYWMFAGLIYQGVEFNEATDWDAEVYEGMTMREYALEDAVHSAILYKVVDQNAAEKGIVLTEEELQELEGQIQSNRDYLGSEEAYQAYLTENYLTDELTRSLLSSSYRYRDLFAEMFGIQGEKLSDQEAILFGDENGYFRAKHILMANQDADGTPLDEETMAAKRATLEGVLKELREAEDPVAVFDARMWDFSEDPGLSGNPDGYQYRRGRMVQAFQDAVEALDNYDFSDITEMEYGYTIVMRLPLDPDAVILTGDNYAFTLRYSAATYAFELLVQSWIDEAEMAYTDAFDRIDPATAW